MNMDEFVMLLSKAKINEERRESIERAYGCNLPDEFCRIVSLDTPLFFDGGRVMDVQEIIYASDDYGVDYIGLGLIPCIDCYDNDFVVYDISKQIWTKFNVSDKICFGREATELADMLTNHVT